MTRNDFKEYCLRALGKPVIKINVADEQVEDRIDQGLKLWSNVHTDAMIEVYHKHEVTQTDINNGWITIPETIYQVTEVIPIKSRQELGGIFNIEYQLHLNDIFDLSFAGGIVNYVQVKQYLGFLEDTLHGRERVSWSRTEGRLHIHMDWSKNLSPGQYLFVRAYRPPNPATANRVYDDYWLQLYVIELIRKQWGDNLSLFNGVALLGGVTMNGLEIATKAETRLRELEEELYNRFSPPPMGIVG